MPDDPGTGARHTRRGTGPRSRRGHGRQGHEPCRGRDRLGDALAAQRACHVRLRASRARDPGAGSVGRHAGGARGGLPRHLRAGLRPREHLAAPRRGDTAARRGRHGPRAVPPGARGDPRHGRRALGPPAGPGRRVRERQDAAPAARARPAPRRLRRGRDRGRPPGPRQGRGARRRRVRHAAARDPEPRPPRRAHGAHPPRLVRRGDGRGAARVRVGRRAHGQRHPPLQPAHPRRRTGPSTTPSARAPFPAA